MKLLPLPLLLLFSMILSAQPDYLVWRGPNVGAFNGRSADSIAAAIETNGFTAYITEDLFDFGQDLSIFRGVFVVLGIYPNNHVIATRAPEGAALENYLFNGGRLYLEGGNCWDWDTVLLSGFNLHPLFGTEQPRLAPPGPDLSGIEGAGLVGEFSFQYGGEDNYMAKLKLVDGEVLWRNDINGDTSGVIYGGYGSGRSIGVVPGFGFLDSNGNFTQRDLMARYLELFNRRDLPVFQLSPTSLTVTLQQEERRTRNLTLSNGGGWLSDYLNYTISPQPARDWLVISPDSGGVQYRRPLNVQLYFDATGLQPGTYSTILEILTNDPDRPRETVEITLNVVPQTRISVESRELAVQIPTEGAGLDTLILRNTGLSPLSYTLSRALPVNGDAPENILPPTTLSPYLPGPFPVSMGRAPRFPEEKMSESPTPQIFTQRIIAHSFEQAIFNPYRTRLDLSDTKTLPRLGNDRYPSDFDNAGAFPAQVDQSYYYSLDNAGRFQKLDTLSGSFDFIATLSTGNFAEKWTAMAVDPQNNVIYAVASDGLQSYLYTIDPAGTIGYVGEIGFPTITSLAIDGAGNFFAVDLLGDQLISIRREDGLGEVIGSLGFDTNFGQGMEWEPRSDRIFMAAINNNNFNAELRLVNRLTGATEYLSDIGTSRFSQLGFLAFPGGLGAGPWLSFSHSGGTLAPGESDTIAVTFSASGLTAGVYPADIRITSNDLSNPVVRVATTLSVTGNAALTVDDSLAFGTIDLGQKVRRKVRITNSGDGPIDITAITSTSPLYNVLNQPPLTVESGITRAIEVEFNPIQTGSFPALLTFRSERQENFVVQVSGGAVFPAAMDLLSESYSVTLAPGDSADLNIRFRNNSGLPGRPLTWSAIFSEAEASLSPSRVFPETQAALVEIPREQLSFGPPPPGSRPDGPFPEPDYAFRNLLPREAHGIEQENDYRTVFSLNTPEVLPNEGPNFSPSFEGAGTFGINDQSFYYLLTAGNEFFRIDTLTGRSTLLGTPAPFGNGHTWSAMSADPTTGVLYAASSFLNYADFFTLDPESGTATYLGRNYRIPALIAMAFNPEGRLFAYSITSQRMYEVDLENNEATELGPLGFGANFGQGMAWDHNTQTMILAAFDGITFTGQLRAASLITGATYLLGILGEIVPGNNYQQLGFLAIPNRAFRFMKTAGADKGVLDAEAEGSFNLRVFAGEVPDTTFRARIRFNSNDPDQPARYVSIAVNVDASVGISDELPLPNSFSLEPNFPNPFNPSTAIAFNLPEPGEVLLTVFDPLGRKIRTLVAGQRPAGRHQVTWTGTDQNGETVASGIYLYQLVARDPASGQVRFRDVGKMVYMK